MKTKLNSGILLLTIVLLVLIGVRCQYASSYSAFMFGCSLAAGILMAMALRSRERDMRAQSQQVMQNVQDAHESLQEILRSRGMSSGTPNVLDKRESLVDMLGNPISAVLLLCLGSLMSLAGSEALDLSCRKLDFIGWGTLLFEGFLWVVFFAALYLLIVKRRKV